MAGILSGLKTFLMSALGSTTTIDAALEIARLILPVPRYRNYAAALRYVDVVGVLERDEDFPTDYAAKLDVITGGEPFILGMPAGPAFNESIGALRRTTPASDIPNRLVPATLEVAQRLVDAGGGQIEMVSYVRDITAETLNAYFGTPDPPDARLMDWAITLFTFLFADMNNDPVLDAEVAKVAPALRDYIDSLIAARKASPGGDDVLGRALALQAQGVPGLSDVQIRTALVGFIVAGLPQPAIAAPQALNQLFVRNQLAGAQKAARSGDDALLGAYFFEALRFDPLAPFLIRRAAGEQMIGSTSIADGTLVFAVIQSAMMDGRVVKNPGKFDVRRPPDNYLSFGAGMHMCYAKAINEATIPLMIKPLLTRKNLRPAAGEAGQLVKKGPFPRSFTVAFD